jgi:hypothetical protein
MIATRQAADQARERAAAREEELARAQLALKSAEQERDTLSRELETEANAAAQAGARARREGQASPKPRVEALQKRIALEQLDNEVDQLAKELNEAQRARDSTAAEAANASRAVYTTAKRIARERLFELEAELRARFLDDLAFAETIYPRGEPEPNRSGFTVRFADDFHDPYQVHRKIGKHRGFFELHLTFDQVTEQELEAARQRLLELGSEDGTPSSSSSKANAA